MPLIVWTNPWTIGVKLLDNDHKMLVLLINQLHDELVTGGSKSSLKSSFDALVKFACVHHRNEDRLLAETAYPGAAAHHQEHDRLLGHLIELQARFANNTQLADELEIVHQLREWLFNHTQSSDREFAAHLKSHGANAILAAHKFSPISEVHAHEDDARIVQEVC